MPSLIPRAIAAVLAPGPTLPFTMRPDYHKPAPLTEVVIDSAIGPNTKKPVWYTVKPTLTTKRV